ncbi:MAG: type II secretion system protein [Candidatus Peribacteraceae bacterium]|nr:type II secretion system protein [Candidatus Peribacteraceae bacterium]MDD5741819.1 type II secretion system protein [Candidatus Peribacteraceae bacterium]
MSIFRDHRRPGTTLVELLLFLAFFAIVGGTVVSILFATSDQRMRQQTIASVERTGLQAMQSLRWRIEHAERIMDPLSGHSGSILALQMASASDDPLIIAAESGSLVFVLRDTKKILTPEGMAVSHVIVRNLSPSAARPTILLSFDLAEDFPLPSSPVPQYLQHFEMAVSLLPEDSPMGNECGCDPPVCQSGIYQWQVCTAEECVPADTALPCS